MDTLGTIYEDFIETGKVRLVFKDFPLNGSDSILAAQASYCAQDQDRYWEYHDVAYQNRAGERTGWVTRDALNGFADSIQLDLVSFNTCLDNMTYENKVLESYQSGQESGIDATPSFLVYNDDVIIKIRGNQPQRSF